MANHKNSNLDNGWVNLRKFNFTQKYKRICFQSAVCKNTKKSTNMLTVHWPHPFVFSIYPFFSTAWQKEEMYHLFSEQETDTARKQPTKQRLCECLVQLVHQCTQIWPLMKPFTCRCRPGCVDTSLNSGNCCSI